MRRRAHSTRPPQCHNATMSPPSVPPSTLRYHRALLCSICIGLSPSALDARVIWSRPPTGSVGARCPGTQEDRGRRRSTFRDVSLRGSRPVSASFSALIRAVHFREWAVCRVFPTLPRPDAERQQGAPRAAYQRADSPDAANGPKFTSRCRTRPCAGLDNDLRQRRGVRRRSAGTGREEHPDWYLGSLLRDGLSCDV